MQSAVMLGSCRCDSSSSETKDEGVLSRGSGGQMPHFLSDLAPLARSQPVVKCSGKLVRGKREGEELGWHFAAHGLLSHSQPSPQTLLPSLLIFQPSLRAAVVAVAPAAVRLGSRAFQFCSPASWAASLPAPHLPHSPPNTPLWLMGPVRDKWLTDSSVGGADPGVIWIEAANQTA